MIELFFVMCLLTSSTSLAIGETHSTLKDDLEFERQLNLINKSAIKSIHVFTHTYQLFIF